MSTQSNRLEITNGPSDRQLVDAFYYAYPRRGTRTKPMKSQFSIVTALDAKGTVDATIQALRHEDSSGESFMVEGHLKFTGSSTVVNFKGYYHARKRSGYLELIL